MLKTHYQVRAVRYGPWMLFLLIGLSLSAMAYFVQDMTVSPVSQAASSSTGLLYVDPANIASLLIGSTFSVSIKASGMDYFTTWDIIAHTNSSVVTPLNLTFKGNYFEANTTASPTELANCINGTGIGCRQGFDGIGDAHSAASILGRPSVPTPINGTVFTITYKVTGTGFSYIDLVYHSLSAIGTHVAHTVQYAIYGIARPDFRITTNPTTIKIAQGSSNTTTIVLNSTQGFTGIVSLTSSSEFKSVFTMSTLSLLAGGSATTQLTLTDSAFASATIHVVTISASNGMLTHSATLSVNVITRPDFKLAIVPGQLLIHSGSSANTTIELISQSGFSGDLNLTVQTPPRVGYALSSSRMNVPLDGMSTASLKIDTPVVSLPYHYTINVTATTTNGLSRTQELIITPPNPSLSVETNPVRIIIRAGETVNSSIVVRSIDYLNGYVYLSGQMNGGAVSFDTTRIRIDLPDSENGTTIPSGTVTMSLSVPSNAIPGNYVILLEVYQIAPALQSQIPIEVTITSSSPFHSVQSPVTILGLNPVVYFSILGVLAIPLALLTVQTLRKRRRPEDESWKA